MKELIEKIKSLPDNKEIYMLDNDNVPIIYIGTTAQLQELIADYLHIEKAIEDVMWDSCGCI